MEQQLLDGTVTLRPFRGSDAEAVNLLFKIAYGPEYPYRMSAQLSDGTYGYVAVVQATGEVIGFARTRWLAHHTITDAYPLVHELGGYVVTPKWRRHGIGSHLSRLCEEAARAERGEIHVNHSEPVCWGNGLASQQIFARRGFRVCGISAIKYPEISPDHHGAQPASMVIVAKRSDRDHDFTLNKRYLPGDYEVLVRALFPEDISGDLSAHPMPMPIFHEPVVTANDIGAEIVDIPANWSQAASIIQNLRHDGWLFSGFLPEHGALVVRDTQFRFDYVRLYRPPMRYRSNVTWDLLGTHDPLATRVKAFLAHEHAHSLTR
jgi:ribosomal protein S18 acetylase RimI-like enzyme